MTVVNAEKLSLLELLLAILPRGTVVEIQPDSLVVIYDGTVYRVSVEELGG